jgi:hypothetical protein
VVDKNYAVVWKTATSAAKGTYKVDVAAKVLRLTSAAGAVLWQQAPATTPASTPAAQPSPSPKAAPAAKSPPPAAKATTTPKAAPSPSPSPRPAPRPGRSRWQLCCLVPRPLAQASA